MSSAPVSASQRARNFYEAGDLKSALRIVSGWRPSKVVSKDQLKVMSLGYECLVRPAIYRAIGRNVELCVAEAERVFVSVLVKEGVMGIKINKDAATPKPAASVVAPAPVLATGKPQFIKSGASAKAALSAVLSPDEDFLGKDLFYRAGELKDRADLLMVDRSSVLLELSLLTCPYKVGDYLRLNRGLGAGGLVVEAIMGCEYPAFNNRWAIQTCGLTKEGSVSRRTLLLSEWQLTNNNAGLIVLEHKGASK